jgi:hypothetical protein
MISYVRVRTIKAGKFGKAKEFLKDYIGFVKNEIGVDVRLGVEVGKLGTITFMSTFDNAQAWEEAMSKMRSSANYTAMIDQSAEFFEAEVVEHLIAELPM